MKLEIRKAIKEDAAELLRLMKILGKESDNLTFGEEGLPFTEEEEAAYIERVNSSKASIMYVALDSNKIVGTASFFGHLVPRLSHRGEVSVAVMSSHWGLGIGYELLSSAIEFGRARGAEIISLEVRSDNARAIRLYKRCGFKKIGTFKGFLRIDGNDVDFDLMNLYL